MSLTHSFDVPSHSLILIHPFHYLIKGGAVLCISSFLKNPPLPKSLARLKKSLQKNGKNIQTQTEDPIISEIRDKTEEFNRNNVTRTKAYLDYFRRHPEIHWAFLAHMVSRNAGWNMTDLKGEFLPVILSEHEINRFFDFLERGNWLIFQDAFPQLLLYEESKKRKQNLFYFLSSFHVSSFMEAVWNDFWANQDEFMLTVALIINEQSYIEERVIKNPKYKKEVFDSLEFRLQELLSLNHILFPYHERRKVNLKGATVHHFESLHERILLGKRLYSILFSNGKINKLVEDWAKATTHSGSRKDYWPAIFNHVRESVASPEWKIRLKSCRLSPDFNRFYSPQLTNVWNDQTHQEAEIGDWYKNWKVIYYLLPSTEKEIGSIEANYCNSLEKLELVAVTKNSIL